MVVPVFGGSVSVNLVDDLTGEFVIDVTGSFVFFMVDGVVVEVERCVLFVVCDETVVVVKMDLVEFKNDEVMGLEVVCVIAKDRFVAIVESVGNALSFGVGFVERSVINDLIGNVGYAVSDVSFVIFVVIA